MFPSVQWKWLDREYKLKYVISKIIKSLELNSFKDLTCGGQIESLGGFHVIGRAFCILGILVNNRVCVAVCMDMRNSY